MINKHKTLAFAFILVIAASCFAVCSAADATTLHWSQTYPRSVNYEIGGYQVSVWGDEGRCVAQTNDDGYVVCGTLFWVYGSLIRLDSEGDIQWNRDVGERGVGHPDL